MSEGERGGFVLPLRGVDGADVEFGGGGVEGRGGGNVGDFA